jgi:branched-chain amino acid transport system ATP-binding protein
MLEIRSLNAWWGSAQALFGIDLQVGDGEMVVLQGLNGAGKSTLLQALIGIGPEVTGEIRFEGHAISGMPPHARARAGLGYVAEDRRLFTALSVRDNLLIAARADGREHQLDLVLQLFPALAKMLPRPASQMSGGEQQMLAIGRTLMTQPRMLILDEPCEGIAPVLVESVRDALLLLKQRGMPMLVAEQNQILASRADRVITLAGGSLMPDRSTSP